MSENRVDLTNVVLYGSDLDEEGTERTWRIELGALRVRMLFDFAHGTRPEIDLDVPFGAENHVAWTLGTRADLDAAVHLRTFIEDALGDYR